MTLSIDDLPAPFGPMIARISPSRMSKEMSRIAVTPPKRSVMCRISINTSPMRRGAATGGAAATLTRGLRR